jgi:hypothetical protein
LIVGIQRRANALGYQVLSSNGSKYKKNCIFFSGVKNFHDRDFHEGVTAHTVSSFKSLAALEHNFWKKNVAIFVTLLKSCESLKTKDKYEKFWRKTVNLDFFRHFELKNKQRD